MRLSVKTLAVVLAVLSAGACGGKPSTSTGQAQPQRQEQPVTTVLVENRGWVDMTIYVIRGAQRQRLGIVPATSTRRFEIPRTLIFGVTALRFLADPIGSDITPVSNELAVTPGQEVKLLIPYSR